MKWIFSKKWLRILLVMVGFLVAIQLIRPEISNPVITADITASDSVKMVLRSSCYNCHSNEVRLAWFDKLTPANWLVARDIREGRKSVNFSEWNNVTTARQKGILFESLNHMQFFTMPLDQYTLLHPTAKTGVTEIGILKRYLRTQMVVPAVDSVKSDLSIDQYKHWISDGTDLKEVMPSLNGFVFNPTYKDWAVISATVRDDNGTFKIILGNDIAVQATKKNQTNPWPDGTSFAKLTWIQTADGSGNIFSGEFKQIAFMVKDAEKYHSTEGWGFSQWDKGLELSTHGKSTLFTTECVNCHKPMKNYDYVFTFPLPLSSLPELGDKLITSFADSKAHTMSTLYGNDIAVKFARSPDAGGYPENSQLTLLTWNQKEDTHWFGASIADTIVRVEKIIYFKNNNAGIEPSYKKYNGNSITLVEGTAMTDVNARIAFITGLRAAVIP